MWMRTFLAALGLSLLSNISEAQRAPFTENEPVTLGSTYSLQSEALGEQRKFFVALPPGGILHRFFRSELQVFSEHYGYLVAIPTQVASRVGLNLLLNKEFAAALDVFEYTIANLAQGPAEYHQLGRALRALGRNEEALAAFENALAVGAGSPDYESIVLDRDAVAKDLAK